MPRFQSILNSANVSNFISKEIIFHFLHHLNLVASFQIFEPGHIFQVCKNAFE